MDWIWIVVVVLAVAAAAALTLRRQRRLPPGDKRPPGAAPASAARTPRSAPRDEGPPPMLSRDMLVNRNRVLDPRAWDDTPDAAESDDDSWAAEGSSADDGDDLPVHFDREYLLRRRDQPPTPPTPLPDA